MRLNGLDSLRGIFATMIVLLHMPFQSHLYYSDFVRNSDIFVEFFFVLSGFVISLSAANHVADARSASGFMIRRVGRLAPLHLFMLAAFLLVMAAKIAADRLGFVALDDQVDPVEMRRFILENVFLVHAFRNDTVYWLNFPSWSISAELWAYTVFAIFCLAPKRLMPWLAAATVVGSFAVIAGLIEPGFGHFFGNGLWRGICFFFVGYFCYVIWTQIRHFDIRGADGLELGGVAAVIGLTIASGNRLVELIMPIVFLVVILIFAFQRGVVSRLLLTAPFQALGERSYSIYMVHAFVLSIIGLMVRLLEKVLDINLHSPNRLNPSSNSLIDFGNALVMDVCSVAVVGLVVLLAGYTYRLVEVPGQTLFKPWAERARGRMQTYP